MPRRAEIQKHAAVSNERQTTKTLGSLVRRMNEQVILSENATQILTCSSIVLQDANLQFGSVSQTIRSSGSLLSKYTRRETTDKIMLMLALILYFAVIIYILQKRTFTPVYTDF